MELCSTCAQLLRRSQFTISQWRKGPHRKCGPCIERIRCAGPLGAAALEDHTFSCGLVDGRKHKAPRCGVRDRARRARPQDFAYSNSMILAFDKKFALKSDTIQAIASLHADVSSQAHFHCMHWLHAHALPVPHAYTRDFLTSVRSPMVEHLPFSSHTTTSKNDLRPLGTFTDSPLMSRGMDLKFSCTQAEELFITSIPSNRIVRHAHGTVLIDPSGLLAGARCSTQLGEVVCGELLQCFFEMERVRDFLQRGKEVANVCANYVVTGLKCDLNTKLIMTHHARDTDIAHPESQMRLKLKRLFLRYVWTQ